MGTLWSIKICSNFSYLYQLQNISNWYITWGQNLYRVEFKHSLILSFYMSKVKSVQEASAKFFAVQMLKSKIFPIEWKNKWNNEHHSLSFQFVVNLSCILMFFVLFFHVVCKISNFDKWTATNLVQASCTELTLRLEQYLMMKFTKSRM